MDGFTRITQPLLDVTEVLVDAHKRGVELHGWAIMEATKRAGPTVYRILDKFEDAELVTARWEKENPTPGKPPRRFYKLSPTGLAQARQLLAEHRPARERGGRHITQPSSGVNMLFGKLITMLGDVR
jgi:DNA-binding PadR family transcriptional regulator